MALVPWILLPMVRGFSHVTESSRLDKTLRTRLAFAALSSAVAILCLGAVNAVATAAATLPAFLWWLAVIVSGRRGGVDIKRKPRIAAPAAAENPARTAAFNPARGGVLQPVVDSGRAAGDLLVDRAAADSGALFATVHGLHRVLIADHALAEPAGGAARGDIVHPVFPPSAPAVMRS